MYFNKVVLFFFFASLLFAQGKLSGTVTEVDEKGNSKPLTGANIIWLGTTIGTTTDSYGRFEIAKTNKSERLIVSFIGYKTDTLSITDQNQIDIVLESSAKELDQVSVVEKQNTTIIDYLGVDNKFVITERELQKDACCTLAESFETNASVDVSFSDAITGIRQIEMLGLRGVYTQTSMEALPYIRGLLANTGLSFVPGTWIEEINVSKGIGSVSSGFESITGQIDIGLRKPYDLMEPKAGLLNFYADNDRRFEGNFNYRTNLGEDIYSATLLHAGSRQHQFDSNGDSFMDMPMSNTVNLMQRFQYLSTNGWSAQFGGQYVDDTKRGGTIEDTPNINRYEYRSTNKMFNLFGKTGYVFPNDDSKSFGIQFSLTDYQNSSKYGLNNYVGNQRTYYFNILFQTNIINEENKIRTGLSYLYDDYNEQYNRLQYDRTEKIPGGFFEYTYMYGEEITAVIGLRYDNHNYYGSLFTPRVHLRYSPDSDWVFRATAGKGYRSSNIFTEYSSNFASSRNISINRSNDFGYGLNQESAWNYGLSVTHYFVYNYNDATLTLDFYRTDFDNVNIADLDSDPSEILFYSVANGAYSNSFQAELNFIPIEDLNTRLAYRFIDSKQKISNEWQQKPLIAKHRVLLNFGYATERDSEFDSQMRYDLTLQWFGQKRIPSTSSNPTEFTARENSPSFVLVNTQITRSFNEYFDLYIGVENLLNFKQSNPIIDPANPLGDYFDASLIWGPINGRMVYTGLRWKI